PLVGPPLTYPVQQLIDWPWLPALPSQLRTPQMIGWPLDPAQHNGCLWAVGLWSERGLIGVFLLGPKRDNGLYTQEEIEIARASGERLIDTQAGAELARSLITLQRQRLIESQLLDRRTRRVLHDEILPHLHTALLTLGSDPSRAAADATALLMQVHHQISDLLREMPARNAPTGNGAGLLDALHHWVADELPDAFDGVTWQVDPQAAQLMQDLPALTSEVLFYAAREAIRNAARYGRTNQRERPLHLGLVISTKNGLTVQIEDDGVGLAAGAAAKGGSQQGLALHRTLLAVVGGTLAVASTPDAGTCVTLRLPQVLKKRG
ncbi:MAG: ATP-binding protein, partial [Chloroflexota bacterium]|nr:ATP-binding protein [Chloroflexota bacterium]